MDRRILTPVTKLTGGGVATLNPPPSQIAQFERKIRGLRLVLQNQRHNPRNWTDEYVTFVLSLVSTVTCCFFRLLESKMVRNPSFVRWLVFAAFVLVTGSIHAQSDELRNTFFKDADAARAAAEAANASLLAPESWNDGVRDYTSADDGLKRGRNIEYVRGKAADAEEHFQAATKAAEMAKTVLSQVMKSRQDAANARAPDLSKDIWEKAQREFADAIRALERGDLKRAKRQDIEATSLYRDAELVAIKTQYLSETRQLLADADRARVGRYAPITLGKAKQLLADAERELNENRYDTDLPRDLARQANYEAKHALYLSEVVRDVRDKDLTVEQLVLDWETPLAEIAAAIDVTPAMSSGYEETRTEVVTYIEDMRNNSQAMEQEIESSNLRLADMEEELRTLDERLGGATAERAALVQRLEAEALIKSQFEQVEKMFSKEEARVFREGNTIILRLVGLSFDSGKSDFDQSSIPLLTKVEQAIDVFPRSDIVIEGHTDSHGGDESNQILSQKRADAVQQYMINAMRIPSYRLIATGFGETVPVANNETASGRAKNRRIDIVIRPNLDVS
jgi:outer membrane protein OmpA-like peptidoglycan-associated protein